MKRRNFLKLTAPTIAAPILLNGLPLQSFASPQMYAACEAMNDRILVIIQMRGGNDGLNTVIPIEQYDFYAQKRPTIKLANSGLNGIINLDTTLTPSRQVGLHPSMTAFKELYDSGSLNVVQGVSYPSHNKSHFKSTDLLLTGGDGTSGNNNISTGWLGRFLEATFDKSEFEDPLGIQIGNKKPSLGFHTEDQHANAINLSGQDPSGFFSLINEIGGASHVNIPISDYGQNLSHIMGVENDVSTYAERISDVFNNGSNTIDYPNSNLGDQLRTIARLLSGGSKTKIFLANISGFDTHNSQVEETDTHLGKHASLLNELAEAIKAFQEDLAGIGLEDKVMTVTFSEFGRKLDENGNFGTDHGTIAPLFVVGKCVNGGVTGENIQLAESRIGDEAIQHDYRQVFTTLIQDWMGCNDTVLNEAFFGQFNDQKLDLIKNGHSVDPTCYIPGTTVGIFDDIAQDNMLSVYPNPAISSINVEITPIESGNFEVFILNLAGQTVQSKSAILHSGFNIINANIEDLPTGTYFIQVIKDRALFARGQFMKL